MIYTEYEWDPEKARSNWEKHGITFEQAITAFDDPGGVVVDDIQHSVAEHRKIWVGSSDWGILTVVYTERGPRKRPISARRSSRKERRAYYEAQREN
jgi:uncharacterized DUF497 family protein